MFDFGTRRNLFIFGIVMMALNMLVWTREWFGSFMNYPVIGEIDVQTLIGIAMLGAAYLFYKRLYIG